MKRVQPYADLATAYTDLDNGGRFWNFFSRARDQVITAAELAKASGTLGDLESAFAYYEMASRSLSPSDRATLDGSIAQTMGAEYADHKPVVCTEGFANRDLVGRFGMVSGRAVRLSADSGLVADTTVLTPVIAGELTSYMETPIGALFDLFAVGLASNPVVVGTPVGWGKLEDHVLVLCGRIRATERSAGVQAFIEVEYWDHED